MTFVTNERALWLTNAVLPHEPALRRWLKGKQIRGIEIDDIIQETFAILVKLESVAEIRNPKAYFYQTAYSLALASLRRARVVSFKTVADMASLAGADDEPSPEQATADREELYRLAEALASLPRRCQEVFVLRKVHGFSQREVAAKLGISEGTVEKQVHKGLELLMNLLGRGGKHTSRASNSGDLDDRVESKIYGKPRVQRRN
jgi:RNA polymerase sigma factor (sigma-70 family)